MIMIHFIKVFQFRFSCQRNFELRKAAYSLRATMQTKKFAPQRLFETSDYAVLILNRKIKLDNAFFLKIWNKAAIRHVVDGGTNRFFDWLDKQPEEIRKSVKQPDIASGDFDSITEDSMGRLKDANESKCKIVLTEDQDETDFTKALRVLQKEMTSMGWIDKLKNVIVICEFTGRLDHIIANLNTLHKNVFIDNVSKASPNVILMSANNLSWLLPANVTSTIDFEKDAPNYTCGIVPFQGPTRYTSTGLQWNLSLDMVCQFGGIVSTSNKVIAKVLQITPEENHSVFSLEFCVEDYIL